MTKQQKLERAEEFVKQVALIFKQKLDPETLRNVSAKVAQAVELDPGDGKTA